MSKKSNKHDWVKLNRDAELYCRHCCKFRKDVGKNQACCPINIKRTRT